MINGTIFILIVMIWVLYIVIVLGISALHNIDCVSMFFFTVHAVSSFIAVMNTHVVIFILHAFHVHQRVCLIAIY